MGALALPLLIFGTIVSVLGSIASAKAQRDEGFAQQQAYDYNAKVMEQEAEAKKEKARYDEEVYREKVDALLSRQVAGYAASGVVSGVGSPLVVYADTARKREKDAAMIRYTGSVEETSLLNQAQLSRLYGVSARSAGRTRSVTTLLTGLGGAAMNFGVGYAGLRG